MVIGFNTSRQLVELIHASEKRQAEALREIADATVLLAKAIEALVESQKIPPPAPDSTPRDAIDEGAQWLAFEKARLHQMGQDITPQIAARLEERAAAMKVFNG